MKVFKILAIVLGVLILAVLIVPFLIPVPPLEGIQPVEKLVDPDSKFIEVNGLNVHYKMAAGNPDGPVMILLHGFGASTFSWREVMQPLSQYGTVIAYDRPAFGLTDRPLRDAWVNGENPYASAYQTKLLFGLMDKLGIKQAILIGNSAGGTVAIQAALQDPSRVTALVLVDAAVYNGGTSPLLAPLLNTPQADRLGPLVMRNIRSWGIDFLHQAWHNPLAITPEIVAGYQKPLQVADWDRALWELARSQGGTDLPAQLGKLKLPVLVITGDDDRIVPTQDSIRLSKAIPGAQLAVIAASGHVSQEEQPLDFRKAVYNFLRTIQ